MQRSRVNPQEQGGKTVLVHRTPCLEPKPLDSLLQWPLHLPSGSQRGSKHGFPVPGVCPPSRALLPAAAEGLGRGPGEASRPWRGQPSLWSRDAGGPGCCKSGYWPQDMTKTHFGPCSTNPTPGPDKGHRLPPTYQAGAAGRGRQLSWPQRRSPGGVRGQLGAEEQEGCVLSPHSRPAEPTSVP